MSKSSWKSLWNIVSKCSMNLIIYRIFDFTLKTDFCWSKGVIDLARVPRVVPWCIFDEGALFWALLSKHSTLTRKTKLKHQHYWQSLINTYSDHLIKVSISLTWSCLKEGTGKITASKPKVCRFTWTSLKKLVFLV